jgi:AAA+ ATPase superfamily predicted ATPase
MFIGREQELNFLEDKYNAPGGKLVVLYGRRRGQQPLAICNFK